MARVQASCYRADTLTVVMFMRGCWVSSDPHGMCRLLIGCCMQGCYYVFQLQIRLSVLLLPLVATAFWGWRPTIKIFQIFKTFLSTGIKLDTLNNFFAVKRS